MGPQSWGLLERSAVAASGQAAPCLQKMGRSQQEPLVLFTKLSGGRCPLGGNDCLLTGCRNHV